MDSLAMSEAFTRRYKLLDRIAIGGTAEVFHARFYGDDGDPQPVVIKRVLPQFARDERFRRLFLEEACVAVSVNHPNIVRVLDHGELEQTCYIALELVEGKDLGFLLARAGASDRLPSASLAAFIAAQVGEALQFIHEKTSSEGTPLKIIHRDVSPQNILVSYQGDVKLTDFGIAKSAIRQETTVDGTLRGKLDYMAPEQAALGQVDHRTDLFALGCVLYHMVLGIPPFRGENEILTLERIRLNSMAIPPAELPTPEPMRQVLDRALRKDKEERYQQAHEMVHDLQAFMEQQRSPPTPDALGEWVSELDKVEVTERKDAVEQAVKQLLGQSIDGPAAEVSKGATTVFASARTASPRPKTAEVRAAPQRVRPLNIALVVVAVLGVLGWLMWALRYCDATKGSGSVDALAQVDAKSSAVDAPFRPTDDGRVPTAPRWVRSTPSGATLLVNGRRRGRTPLSLRLPVAPFSLELRKPGFRPWTRKIDPRQLTGPIVASLTPVVQRKGTGLLTINSLPWSRVKIDGTYVGNTPLIKMQIPAGRHRVVLLAPGGKVRKSFVVTLRRNQSRAFTFDFTK